MMTRRKSVQELFDMTGLVALVTGGSRGLGAEEAEALAELGAQVIVTSRGLEDAEAAAERLSAGASLPVAALALDVTDPESVAIVFTTLQERFGRLDVLVNNAGGAPEVEAVSLFDRHLEDWNKVIATNLTGTFLCTQAAARIMREQRQGSVINISSIAGIVGRDQRMYAGLQMRPNLIDYSAAKAGILGLTLEAAGTLGPFGIRVNAILPGGFERGQPPEFVRRYSDRTPLGRMGQDGRDLKGAVALLASPAGAYITGACLVVDGGFSIFK
jgi:NAD(P)-dependent dehydrogenase (short-subunit alcohol dehydrogenase family)